GARRASGPARGAARSPAVGIVRQRASGFAVMALPPLGRLDVEQVDALSAIASRVDRDVRISCTRTLALCAPGASVPARVADELEALGLVVTAPAGWAGLSACAGLGACTKARADVRAAAAIRAGLREPGAPVEHWVACERACGTPGGVSPHGADEAR